MSDVSLTTLDGVFKYVEGRLEEALPNTALLQRDYPFQQRAKLGRDFIFPVHLRRSHGITFNGGATKATAFTLNTPEAAIYEEASIQSSEAVIRENIPYGVLSRGPGGEKSFRPIILEVARNLKESLDFFHEVALLYGQQSVGTIATVVDSTGTSQSFTISQASWAAGLWSQMENGFIDIFSATLVTKQNTQDVKVTGVDPDTRTITVSAATALGFGTLAAGEQLVPRGWVTNSFAGLDKIITNSATLFGIDAGSYNLWKGNTFSAGNSSLSMSKVLALLTKGVVRGLAEDVNFYMSPFAWEDLNTDAAALRRLANSTKGGLDIGTREIVYYGTNGAVHLKPHILVKAGDGFAVPRSSDRFVRFGSTESTFRLPGVGAQGDPRFFTELADKAGFGMRGYWDCACIAPQPAKLGKMTGILPRNVP